MGESKFSSHPTYLLLTYLPQQPLLTSSLLVYTLTTGQSRKQLTTLVTPPLLQPTTCYNVAAAHQYTPVWW